MAGHSDIDIAIALADDKNVHYEKMVEFNAELSLMLNKAVDLTDLWRAEGIFLHQILTKGKVIKNVHNARAPFAQKALDFISDYYPIYKRDQNIRLKKMFGV